MRIHLRHYSILRGLCLALALMFMMGFKAGDQRFLEKGSPSPKMVYTSRSQIAAEVIGEGKQTVIFVHGLGLTRNAWRKVAHMLADSGYRSVIWDLSGHGESRRLTDSATVEGHARDLVDVANFFEVTDYVIVGHSYGGIIAQQALSFDAGRIKAIGLVSSWSGKLPEEQANKLRNRFDVALVFAPLVRLLPRTILPDYVIDFVHSPNLTDKNDLEACLKSNVRNHATIPLKAAILHGKSDYCIPSELGKSSAKTLNAPYKEIDTIAHQLPQTHPSETANFILEYLLKK